jgi:hypothetical protein
MPLPKPDLDDRRFFDLYSESVKKIPHFSPVWTNHNVSDPGITFIDLFSWMTETAIFRLNLITDRHRLKYLRLLGEAPRPAVPASVELIPEDPARASSLRKGDVIFSEGQSERIFFEIDEDPVIAATELKQIVVDEGSRGIINHSDANAKKDQFFAPFGIPGRVGAALYLGFSMPVENLTVAFRLYEEGYPPPGSDDAKTDDTPVLSTLKWEYFSSFGWKNMDKGATSPGYSDTTCSFGRSGRVMFHGLTGWEMMKNHPFLPRDLYWLRCCAADYRYIYPPRLESVTLNPVTATHGRIIRDDTVPRTGNGLPDLVFPLGNAPVLYRSMQLAVHDPQDEIFDWERLRSQDDRNERARFCSFIGRTFSLDWIAGDGLIFEMDNDPDTPREHLTISGKDSSAVFYKEGFRNAISWSVNSQAYPDFFLHAGNGTTFSLSYWTEVNDFDGSGPDDHHYVVDYDIPTILFGNGLYGKVPEPGSAIRIVSYRTGGGVRGNILPGKIWHVYERDPLRRNGYGGETVLVNPRAAQGGRDRETISDAFKRLRHGLMTPGAAVTSADYEYIATHTPGLRVAGARAVVSTVKSLKATGQQKYVILTIVPYTPERILETPPTAPEEYLDAVRTHIDKSRILGTRIVVQSAVYVRVSLEVTVIPSDGYEDVDIVAAVKNEMTEFFHPVFGGKDGKGWPLGRMVSRSELIDRFQGLPGINCVTRLRLHGTGPALTDRDGNLLLLPDASVYSGDIHVAILKKNPQCSIMEGEHG